MPKKMIQIIMIVFALSLSIGNVQAQSSSLIEWNPESKNFSFYSSSGKKHLKTAQEKDDESLNQTWNLFSQSFLSIDYLDSKGKVKRNSSKNAKIKIKDEKDGYKVTLVFSKTDIEIGMSLLEKDGEIVFRLNDEDIKDPKDELVAIFPFPFMLSSAVYDQENYYLIPEGNGTLYNHEELHSQVKNPYRGRYYGPDYASQGTGESMYEKKNMPKLSLPVYGAKIGDLSMISYISQGAEYSELLLYPKDLVTSYHWISPRIIYREQFFKMTNQKGDGYFTTQEKRNHFDFEMLIHLFDEDDLDYADMALWFQSKVFSDHKPKEVVPYMNIDLILTEKKNTFLWPKTVNMTSYQEALEILDDLQKYYKDGLHLNLQGFSSKGHALSGLKHIPRFFKGTWYKKLDQFLSEVKNQGIQTSLELNYFEAYPKTYRMKKSDYSQALSERNLYFEKDQSYLIHPSAMQKHFKAELDTWEKLPLDSIYLKSLSSHLYGSFDRNKPKTRAEAKNIQKTMLQDSDLRLRVEGFYDYLASESMEAIMNAPLGSSNHYLFSQDIPFASIVFRSYIPYYSREINLEGHRKDYLLRLLEYGAFPSYVLSHQDESELIDSYQKELYGISYQNISEKIKEDWNFLEAAYHLIGNGKILEHEQITKELVRVRYEAGTLIINYSKKEQVYQGSTIKAKSYLVIGDEKE